MMDSRAAADAALIDKLAELDVIDQADADRIKQHMQEGLAEIKESGDFPMGHQRSKAPRKENRGNKDNRQPYFIINMAPVGGGFLFRQRCFCIYKGISAWMSACSGLIMCIIIPKHFIIVTN